LFLGRIDETKGLEFLLKGFSGFLEKGNREVILVMVGPKGNSWRKTMRLITKLELSESTKWIDFLDNHAKMEAYAGAELFVTTPNFRSGAVLTLVEALLCGKPIIVTDEIGEIPRLAGIDECVIQYGDIEGLARLMERMLSDREYSSRIAWKGREYIIDNLKWSDVTKRLVNVYENCIRDA
jgi:glycosyltransferase involved in cell wall biosynthesis